MKNKNAYINTTHTSRDVWFDDISISNYRGAVIDEHFYYPFGLTLSSEGAEETGQPYKLTTKELEKSFDLNFYDFGARGFDMQRGQWMQIDPLSDKYFSYSPYNYVLNNPVMYVDPDGRIVEDPDNLIQNYKTDISNQVTNLTGMIGKGQLDKKTGGIVVNFLNERLSEITTLENSSQVYRVYNDPSYGDDGGVTYDLATDKVNVAFGKYHPGLIGHEIKHAYQFEMGKTSIWVNSNQVGIPSLYDIGDETEGFNVQRAFEFGISFFESPNTIPNGDVYPMKLSNDDIFNIGKTMKPEAYQGIPQGSIGINSKQGSILRMTTKLFYKWNIPVNEVYKNWKNDYNSK